MIKMPAVHFWCLSSWRFDLNTYFHSFPCLRERFVVRFNASNDTNFQKLQQEKKQSTFTEAQHVSFSYIVLMRPRNVETMIPSDNTCGLMFPANVDSKVGSTGNGSLSSNVCERRTSTGGEPFSLLICRDATKFALLRLRANGRNNSQHCCANNVGSCCVCVGSGVQTDATTPNNVGTCSASWEGYNQKAFVNHAY